MPAHWTNPWPHLPAETSRSRSQIRLRAYSQTKSRFAIVQAGQASMIG